MRSRSLLWSFNYAISGIVYALRTQRNMRLHALAAGVVLIAAVTLDVTRFEMILLLLAIALVLTAELANTAIEATVDIAVDLFNPMAKVAKDVAAGAVLIASLNAVAIGYLVFFDRLTFVATRGLHTARQSTPTLTVIALALTGLVVLAVKAANHQGLFLSGGWPSGHTALAVSAAAAIGYATNSAKVMVLALFIAALVAQSRVESEAHTIPQVILGGLLGFLITTALFQIFFA
ncbi:MAG: diacylglycerol kinase [Coriobacteriia bacterium]|nr:diacylglycerol kinase [Coriobacteriia bacterium]